MRSRGLWVLALLMPLIAGCGASGDHDGGDQPARMGQLIAAGSEHVNFQGRPVEITRPGQRYTVLVSSPFKKLGEYRAEDLGIAPEAPDGAAFITVTWMIHRMPGDTFAMELDGTPDESLALVVDGEPTTVADLATWHRALAPGGEAQPGGYYLVVPEDTGLQDIGVSLEFDGRTETVDDLVLGVGTDGPNMTLEESVPQVSSPKCPDPKDGTVDGGRTRMWLSCALRVSTGLPYHGELGWPGKDRAWLIAEVSLETSSRTWGSGRSTTGYETEPGAAAITLDGLKPTKTLEVEKRSGSWDDVTTAKVAFEVDWSFKGGDLRIERVYDGAKKDSGDPGPRSLRTVYDQTVTIS
ncbi:MAG TPA: hypothetical protein VIP58_10710 [Nocardioides sp.]